MKASEIRELNDADLAARIAELEEERFRLRFRGATEQLEDPLRQRGIRRDIARLKTVQRERAAKAAAGAKGGTTGGATAGTTRTAAATKKTARGSTTKGAAAKKTPATKKAATGAGR